MQLRIQPSTAAASQLLPCRRRRARAAAAAAPPRGLLLPALIALQLSCQLSALLAHTSHSSAAPPQLPSPPPPATTRRALQQQQHAHSLSLGRAHTTAHGHGHHAHPHALALAHTHNQQQHTPQFDLTLSGAWSHFSVLPGVCPQAKSREVRFHHAENGRREHCAAPSRSLDIVLAMGHESVSELDKSVAKLLALPAVHSREPCVLVGVKVANASEVLAAAKWVDTAFEMANVGREGAVYLAYIISYYAFLPAHVMLLHARTHGLPQPITSRLGLFTERLAFMGLGGFHKCHCGGCEFPVKAVRFHELWGMFRGSFCPPWWQAVIGGHMLVARGRITANALDLYKIVFRYVVHHPKHFLAEDSWEQHNTHRFHVDLARSLETCDDTFGGHILERAWAFMFNCYKEPGSHWCAGGPEVPFDPTCPYNGFACFDAPPPFPRNTTGLDERGEFTTQLLGVR